MKRLLLAAACSAIALSSTASAATPYPRFIRGEASAKLAGAASTLAIEAKDGGSQDEGSATFRSGVGEPLSLDLTCVNVSSPQFALASGVGSDEVTTYLVVVEDRGVRKDRFSVTQDPVAEASCLAGVMPPTTQTARTYRGDLHIRGGA